MKHEIESADNGWIVSWWEDIDGESVHHHVVFEIPENIDTQREDPQALIDLLYFIKENVCFQYSSKHKKTNVRIIMEGGEDENLG
jgi:hypothetical protein